MLRAEARCSGVKNKHRSLFSEAVHSLTILREVNPEYKGLHKAIDTILHTLTPCSSSWLGLGLGLGLSALSQVPRSFVRVPRIKSNHAPDSLSNASVDDLRISPLGFFRIY